MPLHALPRHQSDAYGSLHATIRATFTDERRHRLIGNEPLIADGRGEIGVPGDQAHSFVEFLFARQRLDRQFGHFQTGRARKRTRRRYCPLIGVIVENSPEAVRRPWRSRLRFRVHINKVDAQQPMAALSQQGLNSAMLTYPLCESPHLISCGTKWYDLEINAPVCA